MKAIPQFSSILFSIIFALLCLGQMNGQEKVIFGSDYAPSIGNTSDTILFWGNDLGYLRAGRVIDSDAWSPGNIGKFSMAFGHNTLASALYTTSFGAYNESTAQYATTFGIYTKATADAATAMGFQSEANGFNSFAVGRGTKAQTASSSALGQYNVASGTPGNWIYADPLFEIGNGLSDGKRSNALTVIKDGSLLLGYHDFFQDGILIDTTLLFFHRETGAFRVGRLGQSNQWSINNLGQSSFSAGRETEASGNYSQAFGIGSKAMGSGSFAAGNFSEAIGNSSLAIGSQVKATASSSFVIGHQSEAKKFGSVVLGFDNIAEESYDFVAGSQNRTSGGNATALGLLNTASGAVSTALGINSTASGNFSTAIGYGTTSNAYGSIALGRYNEGVGNSYQWLDTDPILEVGIGTESNPENAVTVLKNGKFKLRNYSFPVSAGEDGESLISDINGELDWGLSGIFEIVNDKFEGDVIHTKSKYTNYSVLIGSDRLPNELGRDTFMFFNKAKAAFRAGEILNSNWNTNATGFGSAAFGFQTVAYADFSFSVGDYSQSYGLHSFSMGYQSTSDKAYGLSFGNQSSSAAEYAVAIGNQNSAVGYGSVAMGIETSSNGLGSFSAGRETRAGGDGSVSFGSFGYADGNNSFKAGFNNFVKEDVGTAFGQGNNVNAIGGFAAGLTNVVNGAFSATFGESLISTTDNSLIAGAYNNYTAGELFAVGNGTINKRSNILSVTGYSVAIGSSTQTGHLGVIGNLSLTNNDNSRSFSASGDGDINMSGSLDINGRIIFSDFTNGYNYRIGLPNKSDFIGSAMAYSWNTYSDKRVKREVKPINYGLHSILLLEPVQYHHHSSKFEDKRLIVQEDYAEDIGFLAQEVYDIIPEIVGKPTHDNDGLWSLNYEKLTPVLVKAIQEQQEEIEDLKDTVRLLVEQQQVLVEKVASIQVKDEKTITE
ncbi:tail fiber domain-containing protein [Portibacter marinus]|uniref:tail fiber domain-containing protein n=1 Tax=Portibacter marinus TaxID=2898660 RepID=UPI001F1A146F|nr:tail fiber domain-containing protein [Portibacter marinus]